MKDKEKTLKKRLIESDERCAVLEEVESKLHENENILKEAQVRERELKSKISKLSKDSSQVEELSENLKHANETIADLEAKGKSLANVTKKLKSEKEKEIKRLSDQLAAANESISILQKKNVAGESELKDLREQLEEAHRARTSLESGSKEIQTYRVQIKELTAAKVELERKLNDALTDVEWALKDAEAARAESAAQKGEQEEIESAELLQLKQRIDELQRIARERKRDLASAKQEIAQLTASLEEERAALEVAVEQAKSSASAEEGSKVRELSKELRKKEKDLKALEKNLASAEATREDLREQLDILNADLAARDKAVEALKASNTGLRQELDKVKAQAESDKKELEGKLDALNDKSKKMKALLGKTRTLLQEKEKKEAEASAPADFRLKAFSIQAILSVNNDKDNKSKRWYLVKNESINEHEDHEGIFIHGGQIWIPEEFFQDWEAKGSAISGKRPVPLDEQWNTRKSENEKRMKALEVEKRDLQAQLEEANQAFNTYKTRAQAALKKISGDDKSERKRLSLVEETELERATERVLQLEEELIVLQQQLRSLQAAHTVSEEKCKEANQQLIESNLSVDSLKVRMNDLETALQAAVAAKEDESIKRIDAECLAASLQKQLDVQVPTPPRLTMEGMAIPLSPSHRATVEEEPDSGSRVGSTRLVLYEKVIGRCLIFYLIGFLVG